MLKRKREQTRLSKRVLPGVLSVVLLLLAGALLFRSRLPAGAPARGEMRLMYNSDNFQRVVNLRTGEDEIVGTANEYISLMAVSPDGQWYAGWMNVRQYTSWQLMVKNLTTEAQRLFGPYEMAYPTLSWSPDSRWLAFAVGNEQVGLTEGSELFLLNIENGALMQLTNNGYRDDAPAFSPDGTRLVFTSAQDGFNRLYVMDIATGERQLLTRDSFGYMPAWSPDGSLIAFMSNHEDRSGDIYIIAPDGSGLRRLTQTKAMDESPIWLP